MLDIKKFNPIYTLFPEGVIKISTKIIDGVKKQIFVEVVIKVSDI